MFQPYSLRQIIDAYSIVLRNAESSFLFCNRLMDISGCHRNIEQFLDNVTRKCHNQKLQPLLVATILMEISIR